MKNIKWNTLVITCLVCLLPILPGLFLQNALPENMAVHFDLNGEPDNFAPKSFVVYGLPVFMMLFQIVCCVISDMNARKNGRIKKLEMVTKWILPVITVVLQIATILFNLGWKVDISKIAMLITGVVFLALGICLPEVHYVKNFKVSAEKAKK